MRRRGRGGRGGRYHSAVERTAVQPSATFNQTLQFITSIKLQELEKQRVAYQNHARILGEANAADDLRRVEILLHAVRSWTGPGVVDDSDIVGANLNLTNLDMWLLQAQKDPSFDSGILRNWGDILETHIRHSLRKFDYATLFGQLLNEWLSSGDSSVSAKLTGEDLSDSSENFIQVGRKELYDQKERLKSIIFKAKPIDTPALLSYLSDVFSGDEASKALKLARETLESFCEELQREVITDVDVNHAIKGILASPLMGEEARTTLREFSENAMVLTEVASVLNMRLGSLGTWSWPAHGVVIEMRRHLNGKYRAFTDPEILDAIFLQYLGVAWQVKFKEVFREIFMSKAWKRSFPTLTTLEMEDRQRHFDEKERSPGIEDQRQDTRNRLFLCQLSNNAASPRTYDDLLDAPEGENDASSPAEIKKELMRFIATESYLNSTIHGTHAVIRSDLEWFGPSLCHESILTVLSFFGVSEQWLEFFKKFLRAPLRFKEDPVDDLRIRECGTPISYSLSVLMGEVILFCMDFAVNHAADGLFLFRMHDDLWLWDSSHQKVAAGWREMNRYTQMVGLKINTGMTGSACIGGMNSELPPGEVRWGFLKFDSEQRRFVIDQKDVDKEIAELRRQLAATKSVFGWVNVYNKYMAYFVRNFGGRPAVCFGQSHVDDMIDTLARVQRELFPNSKAGAVGHLRSMVEERFHIRDLPQGYFYFPIGSGGLELQNPLVELFSIRKRILSDPEEVFKEQVQKDAEVYQSLKEKWGSSNIGRRHKATEDDFPTFEEYISQRETRLERWKSCYRQLLSIPFVMEVQMTPAVQASLQTGKFWHARDWHEMEFYQKWIVSLYGDELVKTFGSLEIVDPSLIPVGLVQLFRKSRMKLDQ